MIVQPRHGLPHGPDAVGKGHVGIEGLEKSWQHLDGEGPAGPATWMTIISTAMAFPTSSKAAVRV